MTDELDFDPTPYLTTPRLNLPSTMTLARVLAALAADLPTQAVARGAARLLALVDQAQAELIERNRRRHKFTRDDVAFDAYVDGLWGLLRDRLRGWGRYLAAGRARMREDEALALDLDALERRSERALELHRMLFGAKGLEFLRARYIDQSQMTAVLLRLIDEDGLEQDLLQLSGEDLLPMLRAAQRRYQAMVTERLSDTSKIATADLNALRLRINRAIQVYVSAVIASLAAEPPASVEQVERALQPILHARQTRRQSSKAGEVDEGLEAEALEAEPPEDPQAEG